MVPGWCAGGPTIPPSTTSAPLAVTSSATAAIVDGRDRVGVDEQSCERRLGDGAGDGGGRVRRADAEHDVAAGRRAHRASPRRPSPPARPAGPWLTIAPPTPRGHGVHRVRAAAATVTPMAAGVQYADGRKRGVGVVGRVVVVGDGTGATRWRRPARRPTGATAVGGGWNQVVTTLCRCTKPRITSDEHGEAGHEGDDGGDPRDAPDGRPGVGRQQQAAQRLALEEGVALVGELVGGRLQLRHRRLVGAAVDGRLDLGPGGPLRAPRGRRRWRRRRPPPGDARCSWRTPGASDRWSPALRRSPAGPCGPPPPGRPARGRRCSGT